MTGNRPAVRPARPFFSSGPCAKIPGWTPHHLSSALTGRSHRSPEGRARLKEAIALTRRVLEVPASHRIGIVPGSDTGAYEMAMWTMLGARPGEALAWESFGEGWVTDVAKQLKLKDARVLKAPYGQIADLKAVDWTHDVVFTWNGTTSGVKVPNGDWIADDRQGLAICDATSAVFAMDLPWQKLDVVTWSWQKVMGGEGAHGMLVLSPRAIQRLESHSPPWPLPKIFRLTSGGKFSEAIFKGDTINTPSMLCVEEKMVEMIVKHGADKDNRISLAGTTNLTFTEDVAGRFASYGWHTLDVADGYDLVWWSHLDTWVAIGRRAAVPFWPRLRGCLSGWPTGRQRP